MKKITTLIFMLLIMQKSNAQDFTLPQISILQAFQSWGNEQIVKGNFIKEENCNSDFVQKYLEKNGDDKILLSIPNLSFEIKYGKLNNDDNIDAIVYFNPEQCGGGNGFMWTKYKLLILSDKNKKYIIDDSFFKIIEKENNLSDDGGAALQSIDFITDMFGTLEINPIINAEYAEFKTEDAHCCPSLRRKLEIDFNKRKVTSNVLTDESNDLKNTNEK